MSVRRLAILSVHTSPLAQPGTGDGGGMNVYVRSLASSLARAGVACDVLTRAEHAEQPPVVVVEPGFRVVHIEAGPRAPVPRTAFPELVEPFTTAALEHVERCGGPYDVILANYWLSGVIGHRMKHELDLPLVATFHTLERVKAEAGIEDDPTLRAKMEREVVACSDLMVAATEEERDQLAALYDADPARIEIVPPGVDHAVFAPGDREEARRDLGLGAEPVLLFVGRIQPLKGVELALRCLRSLPWRDARLLVVGGPSGPDGAAELQRLTALCEELGLCDRVRFVHAQPHERLVTYYRAADVCLVPSRAESFGMVALEGAASGTPVVAAAVGGLRTIVDHGRTGFLVDGRSADDYARRVEEILGDEGRAVALGAEATRRAARYSWSITAGRLRRLYADLTARRPVTCA